MSQAATGSELLLPDAVVSRIDISRLASEMERVDNELHTAKLRKGVSPHKSATPIMSEHLIDFLEINKFRLDDAKERTEIIKQLRHLKESAPVIHMTFSSNPDGSSLEKLVAWLRSNIHAQSVIDVGLQPALVAGVYVRTPNHVHDFSLRSLLDENRDVIVKELETLHG